eukprot:NODE_413_length_7912_cov_0.917061.p9 type:complete len:145 gc:universal NODE_413_length_7912_cov_0.917061:2077-1643(-)
MVIYFHKGPCIAGGMMFSFCHDYRIITKGYFQMNEIHLPSPIAKGMVAMVRLRIKDPQILRDTLLFGRKFKAEECLEYGFVDKKVDSPEMAMEHITNLEFLKTTVKAPKIYGLIKHSLYSDTIKALTEHPGVVDMRLFQRYAKL